MHISEMGAQDLVFVCIWFGVSFLACGYGSGIRFVPLFGWDKPRLKPLYECMNDVEGYLAFKFSKVIKSIDPQLPYVEQLKQSGLYGRLCLFIIEKTETAGYPDELLKARVNYVLLCVGNAVPLIPFFIGLLRLA